MLALGRDVDQRKTIFKAGNPTPPIPVLSPALAGRRYALGLGGDYVQLPLIDGPLKRLLLDQLAWADAQSRHWDSLALFHFAVQIANHSNVCAAEVLDEIERAPAHILENARSPQGLSAVAFYLASCCGATGPALIPTIH